MNYYPVQEETMREPQSQPYDTYKMRLQTCNDNINQKSMEPVDKCSRFNTDDFKHQELTNIHDDIPAIHEQGIQSIRPGLYSISNFHDCECKTPNTSRIANNHPTLIHKDGHGWTSMFGCNIDEEENIEKVIVPTFNNLVLFDVEGGKGKPHYVGEVTNSRAKRIAISGWIY